MAATGSEMRGGAGDKNRYDVGATAVRYKEARTHLWRVHLEDYTVMKIVGDVAGRSVLDLACGEGNLTRQLAQNGPKSVRGMDLSEKMIELARENERKNPLGITYERGDAGAVADSRQHFDVVTASWLLVYCSSREELDAMCQGIASRVKTGGRFITLILNPEIFIKAYDYTNYGIKMSVPGRSTEHDWLAAPEDGTAISIEIQTLKGPCSFNNYYLPLQAYKDALGKAGFEDIMAHEFQLDPKHEYLFEKYQTMLDLSLGLVLECVRKN